MNFPKYFTMVVVINGVNFFYSNQFFYTHEISNVLQFSVFQGLLHKIKIQKIFILKSNLRKTVFIFTLQNNYLHNQLTFVFHSIKYFYIVHDHIDAPFRFLLQKDLYIAHEHFGTFCLFLFWKDYQNLSQAFFERFSLSFLIIFC